MIKEFQRGHHQEDFELQENFMDWYFMYYFKMPVGYWRILSDDQIIALQEFTTTAQDQENLRLVNRISELFKQK